MAHDLVTELLQYSSLACFMPIRQLCANLLIPNCLRSNLSYSPLAALELYVNNPISKIEAYAKHFTGDDSVIIFDIETEKLTKYGNAIHRDQDVVYF